MRREQFENHYNRLNLYVAVKVSTSTNNNFIITRYYSIQVIGKVYMWIVK